jgi:hypothetical protein
MKGQNTTIVIIRKELTYLFTNESQEPKKRDYKIDEELNFSFDIQSGAH